MRARLAVIAVAVAVLSAVGQALIPAPAYAGSPHFVDDQTQFSQNGNTLTVVFKEAGLGDEEQVSYELTAQFQCVNPGGNDPQAGNKQTVTAATTLPVQNGQVSGSLSVTAVFRPSCSPPMSVVVLSGSLTDTTHNLTTTL